MSFLSLYLSLGMYGDFLNFPYMQLVLNVVVLKYVVPQCGEKGKMGV